MSVEALLTITCEVIATVFLPMFLADVFDGLFGVLHDRQPSKSSPDAVLFTNMIRSGTEGLLTAQTEPVGIHEVAEVLPPSRCFEDFLLLGSCNAEIVKL